MGRDDEAAAARRRDAGAPARPGVVRDVVVVVPARDEAALLAGCLRSVDDALAAVPPGCATHLVVVDDGSVDGTAAVARAVSPGALVVSTPPLGVGSARRLGVRLAARRVTDPSRCWVLSTDADCVVGRRWVLDHLAHAARGATAVAGTIRLVDDDDGRRAAAVWADEYLTTLDPDGTHPHVHGANLGVRLDAYLAVGGFPASLRGEDHALWNGLRATASPPIADAGLAVWTSARRVGRAPDGFAAAVAALVATATAGPPAAAVAVAAVAAEPA